MNPALLHSPSTNTYRIYRSSSAHNTKDINRKCFYTFSSTLFLLPPRSHKCREEMRKELEIKFKKLMKERNEWYVHTTNTQIACTCLHPYTIRPFQHATPLLYIGQLSCFTLLVAHSNYSRLFGSFIRRIIIKTCNKSYTFMIRVELNGRARAFSSTNMYGVRCTNRQPKSSSRSDCAHQIWFCVRAFHVAAEHRSRFSLSRVLFFFNNCDYFMCWRFLYFRFVSNAFSAFGWKLITTTTVN